MKNENLFNMNLALTLILIITSQEQINHDFIGKWLSHWKLIRVSDIFWDPYISQTKKDEPISDKYFVLNE